MGQTVAFCLWQCLPTKLQDSDPLFFINAAEHLGQACNWNLLNLGSSAAIVKFAAVLSGDQVPDSLDLRGGDIGASEWAAVPEPVRLILLLMHSFYAMWHERQKHTQSQNHCVMLATKQIDTTICNIRAHLEQLPAPVTETTSPCIISMRAALLLLRLLHLLTSLKAEDLMRETTVNSLKEAILSVTAKIGNLITSMPAVEQRQAQILLSPCATMAVVISRRMGRSKSAQLSATANQWVVSVLAHLTRNAPFGVLEAVAAGILSSGSQLSCSCQQYGMAMMLYLTCKIIVFIMLQPSCHVFSSCLLRTGSCN